jgi:predicted RND superfamily exporter protein
MIIKYTKWILRWRWAVILLTLAALIGLGSGGRFLEFTNDYRVFFGEDNPQLKAFDNLQDSYTKNDNVLIMLMPKSGNVFESNALEAVVELTDKAWQTPYSIRVDSISNFQHTFAEDDDLVVTDLVEDPTTLSPEDIKKISRIATHEPLLVNRLISPNKQATGVNITIELPGKNPNTEVPEIVSFVRPLIAEMEAKYPQIEFYTTGVIMMNNAFPEASQGDIKTLIPMVFMAIIIGMLFFLRTIPGTFSTVLVILFSIIMAMGTTGWLGIKLTPPSASAPTMILTLAVADSIHFLVTMLFQMRKGMNKHDAIVESLRVNFNPIFLTSITTAVGFLSMNFSDSPPFQDLGNITAVGVMFAFLLSITFLPAMMSLLPVRTREVQSKGSIFMDRFAEFVIRRRNFLLASMSLIIIGFTALIPINNINDTFVEYFDETIDFRQHTDKVSDNLTGLYFIDYSLDSKSNGGLSEPLFLQKAQAFADWYRQQPEVKHVNVITDIFKRLNKNMHADNENWYKLPEERNLAAQYLLLYEMSLPYGLDLNNQITIDKSATRISISLKTISTREILALEKRAVDWLKENAPKLVTQGASPSIMFSHIGMRNIKSMLTGTITALVLISIILIFALRSFKLGMLSLIPNLAPAGMAFGLWALLVGEIGLSLSVVVAMTLGIVVDDTVHFLSKYLRARREQGLSAEDAVRYAFSSVGIALWVTTLVLVAGFMVLAQSHFQLNSGMGLLTAITISIALIVDFLFLPPLLIWTNAGAKN